MYACPIRFEWHPTENVANKRNHGVSFEEAQTVFYDDEAITIDDPEHSKAEHRFILLGMSSPLRVLLVSHCVRDEGDNLIPLDVARLQVKPHTLARGIPAELTPRTASQQIASTLEQHDTESN